LINFEFSVFFRKDFRLVAIDKSTGKAEPHPVIWLATNKPLITVETSTSITYQTAFAKPLYGWFAYFLHFTFPGPNDTNLEVVTETNIVPEIYPFPDCTGQDCYGQLV
jgi:hypothetical protein